MASKVPLEAIPLRTLQRYHQATLNTFGDGETLVEAIGRRPGFYGPNPIAYLSLMTRRPTLALGDLEEALINDRSLVRAGSFRNSVFLMTTEDFPIYFRAMYESLAASGMSRLRSAGIEESTLHGYAKRLRESSFERPMSQSQLAEIIFPAPQKRPDSDVERVIIRKLCDFGVLIRTTSKGWKGNQFNYALAEDWLDGVQLTSDNPEPARIEVVRRYLRAYGPARLEDIVWWTGLTHTDVRRAVDQLGREVVKFPVDGLGEGLMSLRETIDAVRKNQNGGSRILFLPLWDAYPLGWRDRTRVVDPTFAPWVYDPAGNTTSVIVEEGRVIGLWQFRDGDSITLEFHVFEPYANRLNALRLAAEEHGAALAQVAGARDVRVIERALPRPLAERPASSFLWPLGKEPVFRISGESFISNPMDRRASTSLRSKFLDDERLVRPADAEPAGRLVPREEFDEELEARDAAQDLAARSEPKADRQAEKAADKPKAAQKRATPAPKRAATKKTGAKSTSAKKAATKKAPAKKPAAKKAASKRPAAKKVAGKKR